MPDTHRLLDRGDAALLVIDVQQKINAVMADASHVSRLVALIDACGQLNVPVLASEQYPTGLGSTVAEIDGRLGQKPYVKESFSCVRESTIREAVETSGRRQIIVTGIEAHVCVLQTAIDLAGLGFEIHVPHDAVNSRRSSDKEWALHRMAAAGAVITSTESALFEVLERCGTDEFRIVSKLIRGIPVEDSRREALGVRG
jgi:nicotinamidase-related amidase